MIIGSGMLATAFGPYYATSRETVIYAAGVSNSTCTDPREYARERKRLLEALEQHASLSTFVYFGTCSVVDPLTKDSAYVQHKLAMEALVAHHSGHVIVRLPQVAGKTPNPYTLLNYLYAHISRSERFTLYKNASRNIIDVDDVVTIVRELLSCGTRGITLNVANPVSCAVPHLVAIMEEVVGKPALVDAIDQGDHYEIDISLIQPLLAQLDIDFGNHYIEQVIRKYFAI